MVPLLHDGQDTKDQLPSSALPAATEPIVQIAPASNTPTIPKTGYRRGLIGRVLIRCLSTALILMTLVGLSLTSLWAILALGPIRFNGLEPYIAKAMNDRIGRSLKVDIGETSISQGKAGPSLLLQKLSIQTEDGQAIVSAPRAEIDLDSLSLLKGNLRVSRFDLMDLELKLIVLPDGEIAIAAGSEPIRLKGSHFAQSEPAAPEAEQKDKAEPIKTLTMMAMAQSMVQSLFTLVSGQESPIAALQKFSISQGRLVIENQLKNKTARFDHLDLTFERNGQTTILALGSEGHKGRLYAHALLRDTDLGAHQATISFSELTAADLLAVSGIEEAALDFDMPIQIDSYFELDRDGVLRDVHGAFNLGAGLFYVRNEDIEPLIVDKISSSVKWNFEDNKVEIGQTLLHMDGTYLSLSGQMVPDSVEAKWFFDLTGGPNSQLGAEWPGDKEIDLPH
ncbi:MAG: hypothetical protein EBY21_09670, partial [Alphaproteobacteria bacterium]|nr:hypothetical protein [Alphaproteobacteria bacterium]